MSLEALKAHLFETLEGLRNNNDPEADESEKVSIEQAKAVTGVANAALGIYKMQFDAVRQLMTMDAAAPGTLLETMGIIGKDERLLIGG